MRLYCTLGILALTAGGFAVVLPSAFAGPVSTEAAALPTAAVATFAVDPAHSSILFRTSHMGLSHTWGRFDDFSGSFTYDEKDPAKSSVRLEVKTGSVNTGNEGRDKHLSNNDFFNANQFPTMTFASTKISAGAAGRMKVDGEIELLGVKKPVSFEITKVGEGEFKMDKTYRAGFDASFTINRADFGMKYLLQGNSGGEVLLTISLEGIRE